MCQSFFIFYYKNPPPNPPPYTSSVPTRRFAKIGLKTSVVYRFDTGPMFIDIDGSTCHPPECHRNQESIFHVIFAIFSSPPVPWTRDASAVARSRTREPQARARRRSHALRPHLDSALPRQSCCTTYLTAVVNRAIRSISPPAYHVTQAGARHPPGEEEEAHEHEEEDNSVMEETARQRGRPRPSNFWEPGHPQIYGYIRF